MDKLILSDWITVITACGVLVALVSNIISLRDKGRNQAAENAEMRSDIKYIREKVDRLDDIPTRMVAVEESVKQLHKRIDRLEKEGR